MVTERFKIGDRVTVEHRPYGLGAWAGEVVDLKGGGKPYDVKFDDGDRFDCAESWMKLETDRPGREEADQALTFKLERDLQVALRGNIEQLESGLRIIDGGREQSVASGRIDITATDQTGATVVIELKAGSADREAIGQILSYIGDLRQKNSPVRGILIAESFTGRAFSAARAVSNLQLKKYTFKFSFESVISAPDGTEDLDNSKGR
jgi:hypothetical protein